MGATQKKLILLISLLSLIFLFIIYFQWGSNKPKYVYLIPAGFVGEVEIYYGQDSYEPIKKIENTYIIEIPQSGILRISNKEPEYEWIEVEYYYVDFLGNKIKRLEFNIDFFGDRLENSNGQIIEKFFVGNSEEHKKHLEK